MGRLRKPLGRARGSFSWVGDDWDISTQYLPETLVSRCLAKNQNRGIEVEINDAVYSYSDLYLRKIVVRNKFDLKRKVRIFFSYDFHIFGEDSGDTAMYEPDSKSGRSL